MKKTLITILIIIALGLGYWLISPLFITRQVDEKLEDITAPSAPETSTAMAPRTKAEAAVPEITAARQGSFVGLAGHSGQGTATLVKTGDKWYVRFEDDFKVTNGPDLFVYFGKDGQYVAETKLATLKGNVGGQNYEVPASINTEDYNEVWVWCRAFSVPFAKAELK